MSEQEAQQENEISNSLLQIYRPVSWFKSRFSKGHDYFSKNREAMKRAGVRMIDPPNSCRIYNVGDMLKYIGHPAVRKKGELS